jgi:hypothetical protein
MRIQAIRVYVLIWLGLFVFCSLAYSQEKLPAVQFRVASLADPWQRNTNEVLFEPFLPIDWARMARQNFREFDLDHPDMSKIVNRGLCGMEASAVFEYKAALPNDWKAESYYALTETGLVAVQPEGLVGTVGYYNPSGPCEEKSGPSHVGTAVFDGRVRARTSGSTELADVGFVMMSVEPSAVTITLLPVGEKRADEVVVMHVDVSGDERGSTSDVPYPFNMEGVQPYEKDSENGGPRAVLRQSFGDRGQPALKIYSFSVSGEASTYVFVRWRNGGWGSQCMTFAYSLYRLAKHGISVINSAYPPCHI